MPFLLVVIAVVAIVAGVALLATSGDRGFADVVPDGLEVALPDDRFLTAEDVGAVRFGLAFRGYRMQDVDDVLDRLADEIADRDAQIASLSAEVDTLSRSGRTPIAGTQPAPFVPAEEPRLPQEAEPSGPFTRTQEPSPAAEAAAMVAAVTPDPFRAHEVDHPPAEPEAPAEPEPPALPAEVPAPAPAAAEPLAPSAAVPAPSTVEGAAAAAEAAAQALTSWSVTGPSEPIAPSDPVTEVISHADDDPLFGDLPSYAAPAGESAPTDLDAATPSYVETVPLPETVSDDPALAGQPDESLAATPKPETEPVETDVVADLLQPAPQQPAEHRESGETPSP